MGLKELADREVGLLSIIESATGYMEGKAKQLDQLGVYAGYRTVYSQYQALLADPSCSLEALKRVVFLCWYSMSEPFMFTGLRDLPSDMPSVYPHLERDRGSARPDPELSWMLPWYYFIADFAFPDLDKAPHLASFLATADPHAYLSLPADERHMENRGQMGKYWNSVGQANPPVTTADASKLRQIKKELARLQRRSFWSRSSGAPRSKWTKRGWDIQSYSAK